MSAQLHEIPKIEPDKSVVDLLEHYLERASGGEFSSMVVVFVDRDGVSGSSHSTIPTVSTLIGSMERAKWDIIQEAHDE